MAEENNKKEENNLEEKLAKCEKDKEEYLAGWQRAKADFINYKKEELKRLEEMARYGNEDLIMDLVVILDNFDLGLAALEKAGPASPEQNRGIEKGIYMIRSQLYDILKKRGLQKIEMKQGDKFNPEIAEAVSEIESESPTGTVVQEIEPGYKLYDKILRPARVKISKGRENSK